MASQDTRRDPRGSVWVGSGAARFAAHDALIVFQRLDFELTPDAIDLGLDAALPPVIELESKIGEFGRGERI